MFEIKVNNFLTWEQADVSGYDNQHMFTSPVAVAATSPEWFKQLPGNLKNAQLPLLTTGEQDQMIGHGWRSAKFCLGLRGVRQLGYTIPLSSPLDGYFNDVSDRSRGWAETALHPAMLHGSKWSERENNEYVWSIKIITWPWRARMPTGWRLLTTAYPLDWGQNWHSFSGCVDANYSISPDGHDINSFWHWQQPINTDYNYFNVETVMAIKTHTAPLHVNTCVFSMVPVYDPEYTPSEFKPYPNFN